MRARRGQLDANPGYVRDHCTGRGGRRPIAGRRPLRKRNQGGDGSGYIRGPASANDTWPSALIPRHWRTKMSNDHTYEVFAPEHGAPIKAWTRGVPVEDAAKQQLLNIASLPFIFRWLA